MTQQVSAYRTKIKASFEVIAHGQSRYSTVDQRLPQRPNVVDPEKDHHHNLCRLSTDHAIAFPPSEHAFNLVLEHLAKRPLSRPLHTPGHHPGSCDHHPFRPTSVTLKMGKHEAVDLLVHGQDTATPHATAFVTTPPRFRISPPESVDKYQTCQGHSHRPLCLLLLLLITSFPQFLTYPLLNIFHSLPNTFHSSPNIFHSS